MMKPEQQLVCGKILLWALSFLHSFVHRKHVFFFTHQTLPFTCGTSRLRSILQKDVVFSVEGNVDRMISSSESLSLT